MIVKKLSMISTVMRWTIGRRNIRILATRDHRLFKFIREKKLVFVNFNQVAGNNNAIQIVVKDIGSFRNQGMKTIDQKDIKLDSISIDSMVFSGHIRKYMRRQKNLSFIGQNTKATIEGLIYRRFLTCILLRCYNRIFRCINIRRK